MVSVKISVIVLSYNTQDLLRACLDSVIAATERLGDGEIIVVDNASSDGSVAMVKRLITNNQSPITVKLMVNQSNLGFAKGNNVGVKQAKGRYLLFLNSDTVLAPDALLVTVGFMDSHLQVGALSVKTLLRSGRLDPDCHRGFPTPWASITYFLGLERLFPKSRLFGQYHQFFLDPNTDHEIQAGAGAFMLIRQEVVKTVGSWDESYFFYGEDLDYYYRIKQAGYQVYYLAKPLLTHYKGASSGLRKESRGVAKNSRKNRIRVARASTEAMAIFYRKFYHDRYPAGLTFLVLTGIKVKGWFRILKHYLR